ncbi:MAG TPA: MmcQ/YjbR family DNA-binding protein [Streptosporangiaceae bacterium]
MLTLDDVARLAMALPEVTETERRGNRTWNVAGRPFAWERPFSQADLKRFGDQAPPSGPILAIRTEDLTEKEALLAAHPDCFFTISHFDGYAAILIRLSAAVRPVLREALADGWLARAPAHLARQFARRLPP